jgi:hypothetical protein
VLRFKALLVQPGNRFEVPVGRSVMDLVRADGELVEVQTSGFSALDSKLDTLLDEHPFRIVYPVVAERRIVRVDQHGDITQVRRSPKRAPVVEVCVDKLVAFPSLLTHLHLTVEVLLLREDHLRADRAARTPHRPRDRGQRRLLEVLDRIELRGPADILNSLPTLPPGPLARVSWLRCLAAAGFPPSGRSSACGSSEPFKRPANAVAPLSTDKASTPGRLPWSTRPSGRLARGGAISG